MQRRRGKLNCSSSPKNENSKKKQPAERLFNISASRKLFKNIGTNFRLIKNLKNARLPKSISGIVQAHEKLLTPETAKRSWESRERKQPLQGRF